MNDARHHDVAGNHLGEEIQPEGDARADARAANVALIAGI